MNTQYMLFPDYAESICEINYDEVVEINFDYNYFREIGCGVECIVYEIKDDILLKVAKECTNKRMAEIHESAVRLAENGLGCEVLSPLMKIKFKGYISYGYFCKKVKVLGELEWNIQQKYNSKLDSLRCAVEDFVGSYWNDGHRNNIGISDNDELVVIDSGIGITLGYDCNDCYDCDDYF